MPTMAGGQNETSDLVRALMGLERDAVAACESAAGRLSDPQAEALAQEVCAVHRDRLEIMEGVAGLLGSGQPAPLTDRMSSLRVGLSRLLGGEDAALKALAATERDVATAWDRAAGNPVLPAGLLPMAVAAAEAARDTEARFRDAEE